MNELSEIEMLGVEDEPEFEFGFGEDERPEEKRHSLLPLVQLALCAIAVLGLVFLKYFDKPKYGEVVTWYQERIVDQIQLPSLQQGTVTSEQPATSPAPTLPAEVDSPLAEKV